MHSVAFNHACLAQIVRQITRPSIIGSDAERHLG